MARGGGGKRRTYVRDANGRFASTPGGGGGLGAARKAARSQSGRASTLQARTSLKRSRAKLTGRDPADQRISATLGARAQKGAVTRGNRKLAAAKGAAQTRLQGPARVGTIGKTRPSKQPTSARPINQGPARTPAAQRPGSMTSILGGTMRALAKADAQRIREIESITGQKVRPTAAGARAGREAGARVRATAKGGKVANTLRAGLRELAQSDARTMRGMAQIMKDATPKVAGGKARKAVTGGKKALPAAKSTEHRPARGQRTTVVPALQGSNKLAPLSPQRKKVASRAAARNSSLNELAIKAKEELKKAKTKAIPADNPYSGMTPKARKTALARLKKAEEADAKIRKSQMTTIRAKSFAEGFIGATKQGYSRYDNAIRRSDIRTPKAKPSKPPTRTKGSRTRLPGMTGVVAKPRGLKPGALAARRDGTPGLTGRKKQLTQAAKKRRLQADKIDAKVKALEKEYRSKDSAFYAQGAKPAGRDKMIAKMQKAVQLRDEAAALRLKADNAESMANRKKGTAAAIRQTRRDAFDAKGYKVGDTIVTSQNGVQRITKISKNSVSFDKGNSQDKAFMAMYLDL